MPTFAPSQILAEKYRLVRKLGQGGMGSVWQADHLALNSPVAIKVVDPEIANHPDALARFMREAQSAASLRSPHVVQIFDYGVDQGVPYIAMELLEGESLASRLQRLGRLSAQETAEVMTHVGRAVTRAHEANVTHRDLKPDNIFLVRNDEEQIAKVLDFGIAKMSNGLDAAISSVTRTGAVLGTPYYMSPEQATGAKNLDHRTDIWAMGVIAFECMLGRRPFAGETMATIFVGICASPLPIPSTFGPVPPEFDEWFARACARELDERFATAKEAANALRLVCGLEAGAARGAMTSSDPSSWQRAPGTISNSGHRLSNSSNSGRPISHGSPSGHPISNAGISRSRNPSSVSSATASVMLEQTAPRARVGPRILIGAAAGAVILIIAAFALTRNSATSTNAAEVTLVAPAPTPLPAPPAEAPKAEPAPRVDPLPDSLPSPTAQRWAEPAPTHAPPSSPIMPRKPRAPRPGAPAAPAAPAPQDPANQKVNLGI